MRKLNFQMQINSVVYFVVAQMFPVPQDYKMKLDIHSRKGEVEAFAKQSHSSCVIGFHSQNAALFCLLLSACLTTSG